MQFFSVCSITGLTDKRSVKFQLPWRGWTNFTVVSSETERPMYHLGTDRDPVYTGPNEYLPVQPVYTPWSHRTNFVTAIHCLHEPVQILPVSILDLFFLMKGASSSGLLPRKLSKKLKPCSGVYTSRRKSETVTVSRRHYLFPREMKSEKRRRKFHID